MKKINKIISEEINKYIQNIIEAKSSDTDDSVEKAHRRDGNKISTGDEEQIRHDVSKDDLINIAALARKVYPDHTPEGAQSQLRKKIKGLKNDSGKEYHIRHREAGAIRKALNSI